MHTKLRINKVFVFVVLLFLFVSCSKEEEENYVAKVGNSFLTEAMIKESLNATSKNYKFREEFIREWIERKLIYLDAVKVGVVNSDEYENLIAEAEIDFANMLAIKKMVSKSHIDVTNMVLENFYVENIKEFKIQSPRLIYNQATFSNRKIALKFRKMLIGKGWQNSVVVFKTREIIFSVKENIIEYVYNILPGEFANQIFKIDKNKYSKVIQTSRNTFAVVQILEKYNKNDVLEFEEIREEIEEKYLSTKRKELYNNYLKELYTEYSSEIKR